MKKLIITTVMVGMVFLGGCGTGNGDSAVDPINEGQEEKALQLLNSLKLDVIEDTMPSSIINTDDMSVSSISTFQEEPSSESSVTFDPETKLYTISIYPDLKIGYYDSVDSNTPIKLSDAELADSIRKITYWGSIGTVEEDGEIVYYGKVVGNEEIPLSYSIVSVSSENTKTVINGSVIGFSDQSEEDGPENTLNYNFTDFSQVTTTDSDEVLEINGAIQLLVSIGSAAETSGIARSNESASNLSATIEYMFNDSLSGTFEYTDHKNGTQKQSYEFSNL